MMPIVKQAFPKLITDDLVAVEPLGFPIRNFKDCWKNYLREQHPTLAEKYNYTYSIKYRYHRKDDK
jgi:hypothetical protein